MKSNSKIIGVSIALLAIAMVVSAASAAALANDFKNDNFSIKIPSGTDFKETVNIDANDMTLLIFGNSKNASSDLNSIIYLKDSSADKNQISSFIKDLEKNAKKAEETDKYVVLKNDQKFNETDITGGLDDIFNTVGDVFSGDGVNFSADGSSVSLSGDGFKVSDESGQKVSISRDGVSVSDNASSENVSVNVSSDISSNIASSDYSVYMKNNAGNNVVVISGNNLEVLKSMAETVSFNEN